MHTVSLAKFLKTRGHDVKIGCLTEETSSIYEPSLPPGISLVPLWKHRRNARLGVLGWIKSLRDINAQACIYEKPTLHAGSFALDFAARAACGRYITIQQVRPPLLTRFTSVPSKRRLIPGPGPWWYKQFLRGHLRSVAPQFTICVSESVRSQLVEMYRFPSRKTVTIHNGVDSQRFRPNDAARRRLRDRLRLGDDDFLFVSVCRLSPEKGLDLGLNAFAEIIRSSQRRRILWLIVGQGSLEQEIRQRIIELQLDKRVILHGFDRDTEDIYPGSDCFLLPSRREGLPLSLLEAMSSGCCVIATSVDGIPEVLSTSSVGWLIPPDDHESLTNAMKEVLQLDREQRRCVGDCAERYVREKFDAQRLLGRIAGLVEGL
jgi:glycosyltransferase involved in cell wall biosynthesis